jgi:hypothetical protein
MIEREMVYYRQLPGLKTYHLKTKQEGIVLPDCSCRIVKPYHDDLLIGIGPIYAGIEDAANTQCGLYLYSPDTDQMQLLLPDIICFSIDIRNELVYLEYETIDEWESSKIPEMMHLVCYDFVNQTLKGDVLLNEYIACPRLWCIDGEDGFVLYGYDYSDQNEDVVYRIKRIQFDGTSFLLSDETLDSITSMAIDNQTIYLVQTNYDDQITCNILQYDLENNNLSALYTELPQGHFDKQNNQLIYVYEE